MQTAPLNWSSLFSASHRVEYKFVIDGIDYFAKDLKGAPQIRKALMEQFAIGEFASSSATLEVYPKGIISKAAPVNAYCRLASLDGSTVTDWVPQGKFVITSRSDRNGIITLNCQDAAVKAGHTYTDRTAFTEWPVPMSDVVNEIASIMGVEIDARTSIQTGADYVVSYPNDDMLMSEVLRMIAAAHGGNWILTEAGKLRLVTYGVPGGNIPSVGGHYQRFAPLGKTVELSRVTLTDDAGNQFTVGDNTGDEVTAECHYATQNIVNALDPRVNYSNGQGILQLTFGTFSKGLLNLSNTETVRVLEGYGRIDISGSGVISGNLTYLPYTLEGAYIDPLTELGDFLQLDFKGKTYTVFVNSVELKCTVGYSASLAMKVKDGSDDEYPTIRAKDLKAERYVSTAHTYHGNRINRTEGFVSEYNLNDTPVARLIANSNVFSMQQLVNGAWENRIYFDAIARKYKITGDVTVEGAITADALRTSGGVEITGDNITAGTISAARLDLSGVEGAIASIRSDLEGLTTTVQEVEETAVASVSVEYALGTSSSMAPTSGWSTTAPAWEAGKYMWQRTVTTYADSTPDEPHTSTSAPTCIQGAAGTSAYNTAKVYLYKRSTTPPTVDWVDTLTYNFTTGQLTSTPSGWSSAYPTGTAPLYVTVATAHSQDSTDTILPNEWAPPVLLVENGSPGLNVATVFLYQRGTAAPEKPNGTVTYTFATGAISGSLNGWSKTIPATNGNPCFVIQVTASNTAAQDTIAANEWSTPVILVEDGSDGVGITSVTVSYGTSESASVYPASWQSSIPVVPDGSYLWTRTITDYTDPNKPDTITYTYAKQGEKGDTGTPGTNVTISSIQYQEGNSATTVPTGTWSSSVVSVSPGNYLWTKTTFSDGSMAYGVARQGEDGSPGVGISSVSVSYAVTSTTPASVDPAALLWQTVIPSVPDGAYLWIRTITDYTDSSIADTVTYTYSRQGEKGETGNTGSSVTVSSIQYQAGASATNPPTGTWSNDVVPVTPGQFLWTKTTFSDGSTAYGVARQGVNGDTGPAGYNTAIVYLYKRSATPISAIDWSTNLTYSFTDKALTSVPSGWSESVPSGTSPLYVTTATAYSNTATDTIAASEWSAPVVLAQNGTNGTNGLNVATVFLYQRYAPTGQSATPAKPSSALTYTFSSGSLSGTLGDWTQTVPASNGNPCFVIQATASSRDASVSIAASAWSAPVVLVEDGTNGDNGLGIVSIVTEYLLVEGQTTPTGDEPGWTTTPPTWSSGKYIWTRSKITWDNDPTDPDHITYTTPECNNTVTDFGQKYSEVKQNADKIAWLVASGTTAANFTMTSRAISQVAETLSLTATASEGTEVGTLSGETYPSGVYRFSKTSDGYYTSGNGGVNNSVAYGKLTFSFTEDTAVVLKCINRGETIYDFGIVSALDTTLSKDTSEDTTGVLKSFKGLVSEDPVDLTLIIPSGSHFVTFKYKKDSSAHSEGDYFKIKATTQPKPESTLTLKSGQTSLSSAKIAFSGLVTFTDLASAGSTTINGANITTGQISADRIDTTSLKVQTVYGVDATTHEDVPVITTNTNVLEIGYYTAEPSSSGSLSYTMHLYSDWYTISAAHSDYSGEIRIDIPNKRILMNGFSIFFTQNDYLEVYNGHLYFNGGQID